MRNISADQGQNGGYDISLSPHTKNIPAQSAGSGGCKRVRPVFSVWDSGSKGGRTNCLHQTNSQRMGYSGPEERLWDPARAWEFVLLLPVPERTLVLGILWSFFHFILRFWNQILICRSDRHSVCAISTLRLRVKYRL